MQVLNIDATEKLKKAGRYIDGALRIKIETQD